MHTLFQTYYCRALSWRVSSGRSGHLISFVSYVLASNDILSKATWYTGHQFLHPYLLIREVWLADLLMILSTVLPLAYPSGSPSDFCYNRTWISTLHFLYPYAICQWQTVTIDLQELSCSFASHFHYPSALSFFSSFAHPVFWVLSSPSANFHISWLFFYSRRKLNQISVTLVVW